MSMNNATFERFYSIYDLDRIMLPHWKQFTVIDPIYHYIIGTLIGSISLTAVIGNIIIIVVLTSTKYLRNLSTIFILNLAISDLIFSLIDGLFLKTISMFNTRWAFNADRRFP
ncbi:Melanopsin [Cichlidogyrus casuarinus]|uniref:Melanopsin n=1 Tax=Cichlidogyrus casuarinus TaxID=1844966 RepID=A0ABD2PM91_9PLAT